MPIQTERFEGSMRHKICVEGKVSTQIFAEMLILVRSPGVAVSTIGPRVAVTCFYGLECRSSFVLALLLYMTREL